MVSRLPDNWIEELPRDGLTARAYEFARRAHEGAFRKTGEPYITHPLAVARTVRGWGFDEVTVAAALLHDVVEDTEASLDEVRREFGDDVAGLVGNMTKLNSVRYKSDESESKLRQAENIRKFIVAISEDLRVVFVKLADRLHNMRTLAALPKEKQLRIAAETSEIYAALAYRLGMHGLSGELEELAFPYLHPEAHQWLLRTVSEKYGERLAYANRVKPLLIHAITPVVSGAVEVEARAKQYASLYKKLQKYDMDLSRIYDLVALRVIVPTVADCYAALGALHAQWPPLPGRFKDYIALPKPNGYRSLHTTIFCEGNRIIEVQIRTADMHREAELGTAAYWVYRESKGSKAYARGKPGSLPPSKAREATSWIRELREWSAHFDDPDEFLRFVKTDFLKDRIFVITPQRDVVDLPLHATPVDFAYHIHTDIGDQCTGARVNGKLVPLDHELESGDIVEVLIQRGKLPSSSWLSFVKTSIARSHIKAALKRKEQSLLRRLR